jgi:hypothetical protein
LVVKAALLKSLDSSVRNDSLEDIAKTTRGIIFLGTPHSASLPRLDTQLRLIAKTSSPTVGKAISVDAVMAIHVVMRSFSDIPWSRLWWTTVSFFEELPIPGALSKFGPVSNISIVDARHLKLLSNFNFR